MKLRRRVGLLAYRLGDVLLGYTSTQTLRGSDKSGRPTYVRFLWNGDGTPVQALEVNAVNLHTVVVLSPAQAEALCVAGLDAITKQCTARGDVDCLGLPRPRDYDTRNVRIRE